MRLELVGVGNPFRTRLTGRTGIVCDVDSREGEVTVEWVGTGGVTAHVRGGVEVDIIAGVFREAIAQ